MSSYHTPYARPIQLPETPCHVRHPHVTRHSTDHTTRNPATDVTIFVNVKYELYHAPVVNKESISSFHTMKLVGKHDICKAPPPQSLQRLRRH